MFRPTSPQHSLFESRLLVPPAKRARLEKSWAHIFLAKVLPLIDEELYRDAFTPRTGRPNRSIRLLTGVHLLKDWYDLTDEETLEQLEYNVQWQYALGVTPEEAHLPRKTLHNHRVRTMQDDRAQRMFERVARGLIEVDGLSVKRQRLDSTHVIPNMAVLTRLGLLVETLTKFLRELDRDAPEKLAGLGSTLRMRYLDREGYFADVKKEQARRRLPVVARDLQTVVLTFAADEQVRAWESYGLVVRLFDEQVEIVEEVDPEETAADSTGAADSQAEPGGPEEVGPEETAADSTGAADSQAEPGGPEEVGPEETADDSTGAADSQAAPGGPEEVDPEETDDDSTGAADSQTAPGGPEEVDPEETAADSTGAADSQTAPGGPEEVRESDGLTANGTVLDGVDDPSDETDDPSDEMDVPAAIPNVQLKKGKQISGESLQSPHDPDATYGRKGKGYEVQIAETCEPQNPYQVITHLEVNGAHESDQHATSKVIGALLAKQLGPGELRADTGYGSGENIVDAAVNGVDLQAPVQDPNAPKRRDTFIEPVAATEPSPPPATDPLGLGDFRFNEIFNEVLSCPGGQAPLHNEVDEERREPYKATFDAEQCASCPLLSRCPTRRPKGSSGRLLRWRDSKAATATRQREQREPAFKENYKARSGIESTNEEFKGCHGARDLRVRGRARVQMAMLFKANAINVKRACQAGIRALVAPLALPEAA